MSEMPSLAASASTEASPRQVVDSSPKPRWGQPTAALHALGCRLNHAEIDILRRKLEQAGYRIVPWSLQREAEADRVDLLVLNTCTVTGQSDAKSRQALRSMRRRQPRATLAVTGCYAELAAERMVAEGLADLVVGNAEKLRLPEYLDSLAPGDPPRLVRPRMTRQPFRADLRQTAPDEQPDEQPEGRRPQPRGAGGAVRGAAGPSASAGGAVRAHLKIQDGCDFMCSFCIIPRVRGRSRAREFSDLMEEAEGLVMAGRKEIVLTGVNVGTYAAGEHSLEDVVDALDGLRGLARLRISSIEPTTVAPGLIERMAAREHKLMPFLHLPLQSGSDAVLSAMRRRHTAGQWREFAELALQHVPDLCLGTDIMVGFPGEGEAEFAATWGLLNALPLAYCHVFPYSERPGTPAVRQAGKVSVPLRHARAKALRQLSDSKRRAFQERFIGRTEPVLFERSKAPGLARGYTAHYVRVEVPIGSIASTADVASAAGTADAAGAASGPGTAAGGGLFRSRVAGAASADGPSAEALCNTLLPVTLTAVGSPNRPEVMTGALPAVPLAPLMLTAQ